MKPAWQVFVFVTNTSFSYPTIQPPLKLEGEGVMLKTGSLSEQRLFT